MVIYFLFPFISIPIIRSKVGLQCQIAVFGFYLCAMYVCIVSCAQLLASLDKMSVLHYPGGYSSYYKWYVRANGDATDQL